MENKILIVGPAWVGDMIMLQTLCKLIKQQHSNTLIDVLAPAATLPLLSFMPEVRKAIEIPIGHGELGLGKRYRLGKLLRTEQYDQAIITPNTFKSALMPFFARIPKRTGWLGEKRYFLLNDIRHLDKEKYPLMIQRFAALGISANQELPPVLPYPEFTLTAEQVEATVSKLKLSKSTKPILVLCPGAEFGVTKRWPAEYYAHVANQQLSEGWDVWLLGSPKEQEAAGIIQKMTQNGCVDLIGKTSLVEAVQVMSLASNVVCNDSGLMHLAAALKKPLIAVYGSSSPIFTPPLTTHAKIISLNLACSPCFKRECPLGHLHCLKHLMPEKILQALKKQEL